MLCRICLVNCENLDKFNLFETCIDSRTLATIIEYCFEVEIVDDEDNNDICPACKNDLEGSYRLVTHLRHLNNTVIADLDNRNSMKEDSSSPAYITEIEIATELPLEAVQMTSPGNEDAVGIYQEVNKITEPPDDAVTSQLSSPETGQKADQEEECFADFDDFYSSGDDSDFIEEQMFSSDDEHPEDKQPRKRLYYGVKSDSQPKRCCACKEPLDSQEKVAEHSELYHQQDRVTNPKEFGDKRFECSVCFKRFEAKKLYLQHQRKMYVDVLHPCSRCEEEFANLYVLKRHIKDVHKKKFLMTELEELRSKSNICCGCKKHFPTSEELKQHVEKVHYPEHVLYDTSNSFECNVCYHRFKTYKSLKHHQLRFYKEKKFVCTLCGKTFREKVRLAEHENSHRKIRQFLCSYCPATFAMKNSYEVHLKMHEAEKRYNCEYCGKGFHKKSLLQTHLQTHSLDRPFKCHLCPNTFTRQNILDSHLLTHSDTGKPFKCDQCPASYIHQRDLRRHTREKHEGIRSFKCALCPRAYIRQKLLLAHLKSHEG